MFRRKAGKYKVRELADMTPARYDILFALWQRPPYVRRRDDRRYVMGLAVLTMKLGLHPSTISKCVAGLEELGFVETHVALHDRRKRYVEMTRLGLRVFRAAMDVLHGRSRAFLCANALFAATAPSSWQWPDLRAGLRRLDALLIEWGRRVGRCGFVLGNVAYRIYDPEFVDPHFRHQHCRHEPEDWLLAASPELRALVAAR